MVDFAGWSMPVQYGSIVAEHHATRTRGRPVRRLAHGPAVGSPVDVRRPVSRLAGDPPRDRHAPGQIRYSLVTQRQRRHSRRRARLSPCRRAVDGRRQAIYLLVVNASNREKIVTWLRQRRMCDRRTSRLTDRRTETGHDRRAGTDGARTGSSRSSTPTWSAMKYYTATQTQIAGAPGIVSRTGYTGEDGCELILPSRAQRRRFGKSCCERPERLRRPWPAASAAATRCGSKRPCRCMATS